MKLKILIIVGVMISAFFMGTNNIDSDNSVGVISSRSVFHGNITNQQAGRTSTVRNTKQVPQKVLTMTATAYCERGLTKSGVPAGHGKVAVDPRVIPLGTRLHIEGYGPAVAVDTGRLIKGRRLDIWLPSRGTALRWGRRRVNVHVYR